MVEQLLVLNKDEDSISVVNPNSGETEEKVQTAPNPHEITIAPNGEKAYVTCSLSNKMHVIDTQSFEFLSTMEHPDFVFPHGLAMTSDGEKLYMASTYSEKLFVIDPSTDSIEKVLDTHQGKSHMISLSPDEQTAYIANIGSGNISVVDVTNDEIVTHFPVGGGPEGISAHPNGQHLYVANQDDNNLYVIDVDSYEVVYERDLGTLPVRLVFSPDGKYALIPNRLSGDLSIVDTKHERKIDSDLGVRGNVRIESGSSRPWEVKRIRVGKWPGGVVFNNDGSRAYVANNKTNDVSVVDMSTLDEVDRFPVGVHPDGIAYLNH